MTRLNHPKALVLAVLLLMPAACATDEPAPSVETTTTAAVAPTTAAPPDSTTTTTEATTTTEGAPTTELYDFIKPVMITMPSGWLGSLEAGSQVLDIEAPDGFAVFASEGPETTVDSWVARITSEPNLDTTEPTATDVGGAPGFWFDARVGSATEGAVCDGAFCVMIVNLPEYQWVVLSGVPNRIWIVDVDGTAVLIAAEASEAGFEAFVTEFEEVLATVEWQG